MSADAVGAGDYSCQTGGFWGIDGEAVEDAFGLDLLFLWHFGQC